MVIKMKKIGIICEYNPLHNGHLYHLNQIKKESNADIIILSLSSSFTQRGDIAIIDKFTRTKLALDMGVNLVVECSTIFSMNDASTFAYYHVRNLSLAGASEIWIGSESNNPNLYKKYYELTIKEEFQNIFKSLLEEGYSYKLAYKKAIEKFNLDPLPSNDLLGLFYYQAIMEINPNIILKTIKRINTRYDDNLVTGEIQSATYLRSNMNEILKYAPKSLENVNFLDEELLLPYIKHSILTSNNLSLLNEANEGIENTLTNIIKENTIQSSINSIKSKRYSETKIKRLLINSLLNLKKDDLLNAKADKEFLRVLGFDRSGQIHLANIKDNVNIFTNINEKNNFTLKFEMKVSKILDNIFNLNLLKTEQQGPIKKM